MKARYAAADTLAEEFLRIGAERGAALDPDEASHVAILAAVRTLCELTYDRHARGGVVPDVGEVAAFIRGAPWESSLRGMLVRRAEEGGATVLGGIVS